ncbi:endonuclease NucS domain-containing protein [Sedimentitalea nanhaiensis]|uniref:Endonuclease NucS C-terminal domain-containing protein n=2 Tax=Rhodobacterales TaxID=204455 RepID=A0A1I7E4U5_9RHOB|nr:endonuclease NucS domain-containing protein [Sedimentitalea nanhaiensis]SFU18961.1 Protein of unknown function DUF91 [Sedimentitalea nanhaiensis]
MLRAYSNGIKVEEVEGGLLVRQGAEAYVARNWRLTPPVEKLIETAFRSGLECMIRDDHPRQNARWPNPRGVVYLAFSPGPGVQWSLAIDTFRAGKADYGHAVFNGKYHEQFVAAGISFVFEGRNKTAGHLVVTREDVIPTLEALSGFDHSVLALNRSAHDGAGFTTEYVIQREILTNWDQMPWSSRYDVVQDEYPVDGGLTSRRIDILARDRVTGDWLIIELKRAEAKPEAVRQVADYLLALGKQDKFAHGRLDGVLVAERISSAVRTLAKVEGVAAYEVSWPLNLVRAV